MLAALKALLLNSVVRSFLYSLGAVLIGSAATFLANYDVGAALAAAGVTGTSAFAIAQTVKVIQAALRKWQAGRNDSDGNGTDATPRPLDFPFGLALLAALCLAGTAAAAPPRAVVTGPNEVPAGTLLTLHASDSQGESLKYLWKITPERSGYKQLQPIGDGASVQVATVPGTYRVTLIVSNDEGPDLTYFDLKIPGQAPCPPSPGPQPDAPPVPAPDGPKPQPDNPAPPTPKPPAPLPEPVFPAGEFEIAKDTYTAAMAVESPTRAKEAAALAKAADAVAAKCAAGALTGDQAIADEMIRHILAQGTPWRPFGVSVGNRINAIRKAGKIPTPQHWARLLREAKAGLDEAAKR